MSLVEVSIGRVLMVLTIDTLIAGIASFSLGDPAEFAYGETRDCLDKTILMNGDLLYGNKEFFTNNYHKVSAPYDYGHRYNFTLRTVQT